MDSQPLEDAPQKRKPPRPFRQTAKAAPIVVLVTFVASAMVSFAAGCTAFQIVMIGSSYAKLLLPPAIVQLVLQWFPACRSRSGVQAILLVISFLTLLTVPSDLLQAHGFATRVSSADVAAIRAWRATLPESSLGSETKKAPLILRPAFPPCVAKFHPMWLAADESSVHVHCSGGFFPVGLTVGPPDRPTPSGDVEVEPGVSVYVGE